jgi:ectoine hydroxylase-related dioxygenase (phytanoyl-CoA dioxygenase family)
MTATMMPRLTAMKKEIATDPERFGYLTDCTALLDKPAQLREFMDAEGYVYLKGILDKNKLTEARMVMAERLAAKGQIDTNYPLIECVASSKANVQFMPDLSKDNPALMQVLYDGAMIQAFEKLLEHEVRHYDFTWVRAVAPKRGTPPHMDVVYMGRGTKKLYTAWTPLSDIPLEMGGLLVLERSHIHDRLNQGYGSKDVDEFCENKVGEGYTKMGGGGNISDGGWLSKDPAKLRTALGGRWLSANYELGDVLMFSVFTVHTSLDNASNKIRLSTDTRYQRADEPIDERWIGDEPIGHGSAGKRGKIC